MAPEGQKGAELLFVRRAVTSEPKTFADLRKMLGNVATQFEEPLDFDPIAMKIVNNARADALLRCDRRQGWSL